MNIFVLNSGSSSLKFQIVRMPEETSLLHGIVDGIGQESCFIQVEHGEERIKNPAGCKNHEEALALALEHLHDLRNGIEAIGHRVVHGGEKYVSATLVTESVIADIRALFDLAPLHNPPNLDGVLACQKQLPGIPNIGIFDTAFHHTLPPKAYLYGLPYELYEKFRIRKYGFHGISHRYVSHEAMKILEENIKDFKILSCHLGSGASICAISEGKSVEISMGFTPLEGLMMGTRSGSFDPDIVLYLLRKGFTLEQVEDMMLRKGGLKGISQRTNDVRELREDELEGDSKSELAFDMFAYRIQRFIGSYSAAMGGLDVLIFTGGIGEKAHYIRRGICSHLGFLGIKIDPRKNTANDTVISSGDSPVTVMVVPTNEELQIARECHQFLSGQGRRDSGQTAALNS